VKDSPPPNGTVRCLEDAGLPMVLRCAQVVCPDEEHYHLRQGAPTGAGNLLI
jgi:hypothetical protein